MNPGKGLQISARAIYHPWPVDAVDESVEDIAIVGIVNQIEEEFDMDEAEPAVPSKLRGDE